MALLLLSGTGGTSLVTNGGGNGGTAPDPDAGRFTGVASLGDSLIDAGNILGLARWYDGLPFADRPEGTPTQDLGYFEGRFSNGYTFADLITNKYTGTVSQPVFPFGYEEPVFGLEISPFASEPKDNNLNWSYGGAQIRGGGPIPNLDDQTDAMRDAADGSFDPDSLVLVTIGGNDVRELAPADGDPVARDEAHEKLDRAATELFDELEELAARGVSHVLLTGIPDVGLIPRYDLDANGILDTEPASIETTISETDRSQAATEYSRYLDDLIRTDVVPGLQELGVHVTYVPLADVLSDTSEVIEEGALDMVLPTIASLAGITLEALEGDMLGNRDTIFFDHVHPNAHVHVLVGSLLFARLEDTEWIETAPLNENDIDFSFTGSIDIAGESDAFTVTLRADADYRFEMLGLGSLGEDGSLADPEFEIVDPFGNVLAAFDDESGEDAGLGFDASFSFTAEHSGDYTIHASATGELTGSYVVQGGTIGAIVMPPVDNPVYTPNFLILG